MVVNKVDKTELYSQDAQRYRMFQEQFSFLDQPYFSKVIHKNLLWVLIDKEKYHYGSKIKELLEQYEDYIIAYFWKQIMFFAPVTYFSVVPKNSAHWELLNQHLPSLFQTTTRKLLNKKEHTVPGLGTIQCFYGAYFTVELEKRIPELGDLDEQIFYLNQDLIEIGKECFTKHARQGSKFYKFVGLY